MRPPHLPTGLLPQKPLSLRRWAAVSFTVDGLTNSVTTPIYFKGMKREDLLAPIPALPCLHGLYEIENSAR